MENASKALIIAGGIFISLIVVSILVYGWSQVEDYNKQEEQEMTKEQIVKFNKQFEAYNKKLVYGHELYSLNFLIEDINTRFSADQGYEQMEVLVKFDERQTIWTELGSSFQRRVNPDSNGYRNLERFVKEVIYDNGDNPISLDYMKIFKESYFQCDAVVYDGEEFNGTEVNIKEQGNGKVMKLYFSQITRK